MANTYATIIALLRQDCGDYPIRRYETADGDGTTTVFNLQNPKVYEGSYTVQVAGVLQVEGVAYVMNPDQGQIVFNTGYAPVAGNDNVSFQYQSVVLRDADYIDILNQTLQQLRRKLWIEATDSTTLFSVIDQNDYSLAQVCANGGYTDIVYVMTLQLMEVSNTVSPPNQYNTTTNPWRDARAITNMKFMRDLQILRIRPAFNFTGYPMKISVIRAYNQGNATNSPFEPQTRYWPVIRKFCEAEYLSRLVKWILMHGITSVAKEKTFENVNDLRKMVNDVKKEATVMLATVRPQKPGMPIPNAVAGIADP